MKQRATSAAREAVNFIVEVVEERGIDEADQRCILLRASQNPMWDAEGAYVRKKIQVEDKLINSWREKRRECEKSVHFGSFAFLGYDVESWGRATERLERKPKCRSF